MDQDVVGRVYDQPVPRKKQNAITSPTMWIQVVDGMHDRNAIALQQAYEKDIPQMWPAKVNDIGAQIANGR
jgi:hypothetical protein